ncbi:MAG TPA: nucleotidyltransferase domain-containing protein [Caulobacterales bacterium]|jgi:predicted nucleotidyltransferase|nr:nucleotidyltransferase domain-containing protein [Caulobacterales bacterium]
MTREHALNVLRQLRQQLEARGIAHAGLFGSVARDTAVGPSDIDVFVTPAEGRRLDLIDLGGVQSTLEAAFAGIDVDVVVAPATNPDIATAIQRDRADAF